MVHYDYNAWDGAGEGTMDELSGRLLAGNDFDHKAAKADIETAVGPTREFITGARGKPGEDALGRIVSAQPDLSRFV